MARKRELGQIAEGVEVDLGHLDARLEPRTISQSSFIRDADHARRRGLGDVVHAEESRDLDLGADLFATFALRRVDRVLVVIDEAAG